MITNNSNNFLFGEMQFNEWVELAQRNPIAFEVARRKTLQSCIDHSANPCMASRLQGEIDLQRISMPSQLHLTETTHSQLESIKAGMTKLYAEAEKQLNKLSERQTRPNYYGATT